MALVHVPDLGRDAEQAQRSHAADAQDDLLADARVLIAAVQPRGQVAIGRRVLRHVAVEQHQRHAADLDLPEAGVQRATRQFDRDHQRLAVFAAQRNDRELVGSVGEVTGLLPAVFGDVLRKVALVVIQADADERQAEVGGFFGVVAREDAEAAGVRGEGLVQAELGREVGDQVIGFGGMLALVPGAFGLHIGVERDDHAIEQLEEGRPLQRAVQILTLDAAQELDRVVGHVGPQLAIDGFEDLGDVGIPRPPQVIDEVRQACDALRQIDTGQRGLGIKRPVECAIERHDTPPVVHLRVSRTTIPYRFFRLPLTFGPFIALYTCISCSSRVSTRSLVGTAFQRLSSHGVD